MRRPPRFTVPLPTKSRLEPMAAICCCTCCCAPWPSPTMAITAPTPMMMPSMVRMERILLRASARIAIRTTAISSMRSSILQGGQRLQDLAGAQDVGGLFVPADAAVAEDDRALGELRDVVLVGDEHDGQPLLLIQPLQDL